MYCSAESKLVIDLLNAVGPEVIKPGEKDVVENLSNDGHHTVALSHDEALGYQGSLCEANVTVKLVGNHLARLVGID